ncbi:MAG: hypothetical protein WCI75_13125, partial [candidate division NC10 bacterium]
DLPHAAPQSELLGSLACVDAVVPFGEDTPEKLLSRLKPDVLVKGADYRPQQVAGRRHAGKLVLIRLKRGYSTTALLQRIRARRSFAPPHHRISLQEGKQEM